MRVRVGHGVFTLAVAYAGCVVSRRHGGLLELERLLVLVLRWMLVLLVLLVLRMLLRRFLRGVLAILFFCHFLDGFEEGCRIIIEICVFVY